MESTSMKIKVILTKNVNLNATSILQKLVFFIPI